jgi:hypothetical protein
MSYKLLLATGRWFSSGPPVSSTNKTDGHDITEKLLKVALNPGADLGFQVRGGALKKIAPSGGRREIPKFSRLPPQLKKI